MQYFGSCGFVTHRTHAMFCFQQTIVCTKICNIVTQQTGIFRTVKWTTSTFLFAIVIVIRVYYLQYHCVKIFADKGG